MNTRKIKASAATLHYGVSQYPVMDRNLPVVEFPEAMVAEALAQMSKNSGGFKLADLDSIVIVIAGNGYDITFEVNS